MANSVAQKLRIKDGMTILMVNAPKDFREAISPLPGEVYISATAKKFDQVHWFVLNKAQLDSEVKKIIRLVTGEVVCWVYYPKGTSKLQTDLTRDKGWDELLLHPQMQWINLISFNNTWSAFGFRLKTAADKKKEVQPKVREILSYIDPVKKIVTMPGDLAEALKRNKRLGEIFRSLAYSHRKEYVEWIVTAKREETRLKRVQGTLERLEKGWKNPGNL